MALVAGIDSSTQSCKVVVLDAETGAEVRAGRAAHPDGTEVDPQAWWSALEMAVADAGGLDDVAAISVAGQQHGMVCLDEDGQVVRPALLWNDTRSGPAARALTAELGGGEAWAERVGLVPVASFTITKLRWLAEHEPEHAARVAAVCLPHDWLSWRLRGPAVGSRLGELATDRSDASGTGYYSAEKGAYDLDLLRLGLGGDAALPRIVAPGESMGSMPGGALVGPGCGDNAGSAIGLGAVAGDVIVSLGTSGVVTAVSEQPARDASGTVAGFADATGRYLPLVATLNGARTLGAVARLLGVSLDRLSELALGAPAGAGGVSLVPYLQGERTPDRPDATGSLHGLTLDTSDPALVARAAVEGLWCGLADGLDAVRAQGVDVKRVLLIGGGSASEAVKRVGPSVLGVPVEVPPSGEYVARGAARQAAWVLAGGSEPPTWDLPGTQRHEGDVVPAVRARYAEAREHVLPRV